MTDLAAALCAAAAHLDSLGLSPGSSGNLSVRRGDQVWITPSGASMSGLDPAGLSMLTFTDAGLEYVSGPRPSKEAALHHAMYQRDPAATCVVHLHSTYAVAASCLEPWSSQTALPPLTPYLLIRVGTVPLIPYRDPGDVSQADLLRGVELPFHAALLQNHGPIVAGHDVGQAVDRAIEVETAAQTTILIGRRPDVRLLTGADAQRLTESYGQPWISSVASEASA